LGVPGGIVKAHAPERRVHVIAHFLGERLAGVRPPPFAEAITLVAYRWIEVPGQQTFRSARNLGRSRSGSTASRLFMVLLGPWHFCAHCGNLGYRYTVEFETNATQTSEEI
jgi:hypothetical protein